MAKKSATNYDTLFLSKKQSPAQKELMNILGLNLGTCINLKEDIDCRTQSEKALRIAVNKRVDFFVSMFTESGKNNNKTKSDKATLTEGDFMSVGRVFNNQILNLITLRILEQKSFKDFPNTLPPESFVRFSVMTFGLSNELENLFVHILGKKILKLDLDAVNYTWIISQDDKKDDTTSTGDKLRMFFARISNNSYEEIGPSFSFEITDKYFNEELGKSGQYKVKKQRNVTKNVTKDTVGRIYIDKQDLKDVKVRKSVRRE